MKQYSEIVHEYTLGVRIVKPRRNPESLYINIEKSKGRELSIVSKCTSEKYPNHTG